MRSGKVEERRNAGYFGVFRLDSCGNYGAKSEVKGVESPANPGDGPEISTSDSNKRKTTISVKELLNPETPHSCHTPSTVDSDCHCQGDNQQAVPREQSLENPYASGPAALREIRRYISLPCIRRLT
jgi:hypothetical protein